MDTLHKVSNIFTIIEYRRTLSYCIYFMRVQRNCRKSGNARVTGDGKHRSLGYHTRTRIEINQLTDRSFTHYAPELWNTLPKHLRQPSPHQSFLTMTDFPPLLAEQFVRAARVKRGR